MTNDKDDQSRSGGEQLYLHVSDSTVAPSVTHLSKVKHHYPADWVQLPGAVVDMPEGEYSGWGWDAAGKIAELCAAGQNTVCS